jgi:hypothetical protein
MTELDARLAAALADRYVMERELVARDGAHGGRRYFLNGCLTLGGLLSPLDAWPGRPAC